MAKMLYSATMSLDGFIAGPGGDMSWMAAYLGPNPPLDGHPDEIGALLVGARTFGGDDPNKGTDKEGAYEGEWSGPQFVVTHHPPAEPVPGATFLTDLDAAVRAAKSAAGEKYVSVLGADVAHQCLDAGTLDEILVCIAPVLLGDGTRLFDCPGGAQVELERISVTQGPLATNVWFRVR